ncbi:hypothetical protein F4777DRAFT_330211 [Nemania sp. FL0916]|nr:hypothetical protein F4777DRAFT_330211 [Nemania sp. FL0916]
MREVHFRPSSSSAYDTVHEGPRSLLRARPPFVDLNQDGNRIPLRSETSTKRESKIGLRGIFTRAKAGKTDKDAEESSSRTPSRSAGIRASLVDFGGWPYRHSHRSEASLITTASVNSRPSPAELFSRSRTSQSSPGTDKIPPSVPSNGRVVTTAAWNPPPLFQVYPQAVKHATLPVCNVSVDTLARYSETKSSKFTLGARNKDLERVNESGIRTKGDTLKKKPRIAGLRNSWEWTSKIFVLVTSGYLLQYAAEGTFNRAPEKILQLTATSAAYASDLIPGRHWVLQVASATDAEGNTFADTKSRRPKISMRDNRRVSNMLLVFENPENMDDWLATLRTEIEFHGGKKKMSETGNEEASGMATEMTAQLNNQRTIVVKDPHRFSQVITRDFSYTQDSALADSTEDVTAISPPRRFSTYTVDNGSPTVSMISSDGHHLDNLRDSGSSHRLSYMSSGQRTMITSAGSSPACSPTRASFSSQKDDVQPLPIMPEVRLRPNAAAIMNRRQSMQALMSSLEAPIESSPQSYASSASILTYEDEQRSTPSVPNFSVPHTVNKRFSLNTPVPSGLRHISQMFDHERNSKLSRKPPPTSLLISRPLSIVIDQPSPRSPCSPNSLSRSVDSCHNTLPGSGPVAIVLSSSPGQKGPSYLYRHELSSQNLSSHQDEISRPKNTVHDTTVISPGVDLAYRMDDAKQGEHIPRAASSLGSYGGRRRLSGIPANEDSSNRRASMLSEIHPSQNASSSAANLNSKLGLVAKTSCSPKRSAPSLRSSLTIDSQDKAITARRSMPQLNDDAPPAPPPSCALPPVPQKPSGYRI